MISSTQDKAQEMAKNIAGSVKEAAGVGNPRLQAAGQSQKTAGQVREKIGEIKMVLGS